MLAFGGDSAIELASAVVVLWSLRGDAASEHIERRAAQIAGALLFALAATVVTISVGAFLGYNEARPTLLGIGLLIAAAVFMPLLAREKRRLSGLTGSAALTADAAESAACGYLSLIALLVLLVNTVWRESWADPLAALAIVPLILPEGWKAIHGERCQCA